MDCKINIFLSWLSVVEAVPQKWKQQIRRGKHIMTSDPLQNKVIPIMAVKEVYNKLLNKTRKPPTAQKNSRSSSTYYIHQLAQGLLDSSKGYNRYHLKNFSV